MKLSLKKLAEHVGGYIIGDENCLVGHVATLKNASAGDISFLTNLKYKSELQATQASAVILSESHAESCMTNALVVSNPHPAYAKIATLLYSEPHAMSGIHPSAVVEQDCQIDDSVWIGPQCVVAQGVVIRAGSFIGPGTYIGKHAVIGKNCKLIANVTLMDNCQLADRVMLHPGVVVGADGFGQAYDNGKWIKVPQVGAVQIGDDVEVGVNTAIDRGTIEDTIIEEGVKLDNLIQIAHNVRVGPACAFAAQVGLSGSVTVGGGTLMGGQSGIAGHLEIAPGSRISAKAGVTRALPGAAHYTGYPARAHQDMIAQWRPEA